MHVLDNQQQESINVPECIESWNEPDYLESLECETFEEARDRFMSTVQTQADRSLLEIMKQKGLSDEKCALLSDKIDAYTTDTELLSTQQTPIALRYLREKSMQIGEQSDLDRLVQYGTRVLMLQATEPTYTRIKSQVGSPEDYKKQFEAIFGRDNTAIINSLSSITAGFNAGRIGRVAYMLEELQKEIEEKPELVGQLLEALPEDLEANIESQTRDFFCIQDYRPQFEKDFPGEEWLGIDQVPDELLDESIQENSNIYKLRKVQIILRQALHHVREQESTQLLDVWMEKRRFCMDVLGLTTADEYLQLYGIHTHDLKQLPSLIPSEIIPEHLVAPLYSTPREDNTIVVPNDYAIYETAETGDALATTITDQSVTVMPSRTALPTVRHETLHLYEALMRKYSQKPGPLYRDYVSYAYLSEQEIMPFLAELEFSADEIEAKREELIDSGTTDATPATALRKLQEAVLMSRQSYALKTENSLKILQALFAPSEKQAIADLRETMETLFTEQVIPIFRSSYGLNYAVGMAIEDFTFNLPYGFIDLNFSYVISLIIGSEIMSTVTEFQQVNNQKHESIFSPEVAHGMIPELMISLYPVITKRNQYQILTQLILNNIEDFTEQGELRDKRAFLDFLKAELVNPTE